MILTVSAVSIVAYMLLLYRFRGRYIQQQIALLIVYLVGLAIIGELDVLLPIYFVVSMLPFIIRLRRISLFTGILTLYFSVYLLVGILAQDKIGTLVTFIAKIWQFVIFFIIYDADVELEVSDYKKTILWSVIFETLLGAYLLLTSTKTDIGSGLVRLVSNAQPITGNISTVLLPVSVYYYVNNRENVKASRWLLWVSIIMLVWIVLSGTRGYTIEFASTVFLVFYDYYTNMSVERGVNRNRFVVMFLLGIVALVSTVVVPGILERLSLILRLHASVGIRTYENAAVLEFLRKEPLLNLLFGIGIGGTGGSFSAMQHALSYQFSLGMWDKLHYLNDSGALFHNLYANVIMCLGIVGIMVVIWLNSEMWKRIRISCGDNAFARRVLHLFQLSFLLMNYYRWSAVCGIAEMIVLALVLKAIEQNNKRNEECTDSDPIV